LLTSNHVVILLLTIVVMSPWRVAAQQTDDGPPILEDVEAAFARIQIRGEHVTACANGLIPRPLYRTTLTNFLGLRNHFQGIQRLPQPGYLVMSGSSKQGSDLFIVRLAQDDDPGRDCDGEIVARIAVDDVMTHAGGLSTLGSILAVPVHGGSRLQAKVVFFDLANPESPRRLPVEISRPGRKASSTALTRLPNGHLLVGVLAAYDGLPLRVDFYLSRTTLLNDGFQPEPVMWRVSGVEARPDQDPTFGHFQGVNFIRQTDGRLYLVGFHNNVAPQAILPGRDYADLYEIVLPRQATHDANPTLVRPAVTKVANRMLYCSGGYCNLDAAAGLFVDPDTQSMTIYATPGWLDGETLKVTVYRSP
jgi:hypothetical protein